MYRLLLYCCLIFFIISCKKGDSPKHVLIKGRLLQSSSNPVPVADYKLSFYQLGSNAILIGSSPSNADFTTNTGGYFECNFPLGNGYFSFIPTRNYSALSVSGIKNNGIQLGWSDVPATDTDLAVIYQYKKINQAIIQVQPKLDAITPTDTLLLSASTVSGNYQKVFTGLSIPQNGTAIIDTISNVIFTNFSFQTRVYQNSISLQRKQYSTFGFGAKELVGDEDVKTYLFTLY